MISDPKVLNDQLVAKGSSIASIIGSVKNLSVTIHEMKKFKELYEQETFNSLLQDQVNQGSLSVAEMNKKKEQLSIIYNRIKMYDSLLESVRIDYDLYEDQNKQLHVKTSSEFDDFAVISHQYFRDNNLEGEIIFK